MRFYGHLPGYYAVMGRTAPSIVISCLRAIHRFDSATGLSDAPCSMQASKAHLHQADDAASLQRKTLARQVHVDLLKDVRGQLALFQTCAGSSGSSSGVDSVRLRRAKDCPRRFVESADRAQEFMPWFPARVVAKAAFGEDSTSHYCPKHSRRGRPRAGG